MTVTNGSASNGHDSAERMRAQYATESARLRQITDEQARHRREANELAQQIGGSVADVTVTMREREQLYNRRADVLARLNELGKQEDEVRARLQELQRELRRMEMEQHVHLFNALQPKMSGVGSRIERLSLELAAAWKDYSGLFEQYTAYDRTVRRILSTDRHLAPSLDAESATNLPAEMLGRVRDLAAAVDRLDNSRERMHARKSVSGAISTRGRRGRSDRLATDPLAPTFARR